MQFIQGLGLDAVLQELQRLKVRKQIVASSSGQAQQLASPGTDSRPGARLPPRYSRQAKDLSVIGIANSLMTGVFAERPLKRPPLTPRPRRRSCRHDGQWMRPQAARRQTSPTTHLS